MRAKLAKWTDISDVALLERLRNNEEWLRFFVYRIASGKRRVPARRRFQSDDPDCGWHDRRRPRQGGNPMEDAVQHQSAEFEGRGWRTCNPSNLTIGREHVSRLPVHFFNGKAIHERV